MYSLLIKLMLISALLELGITQKDFHECISRLCLKRIERASRVISVIWKFFEQLLAITCVQRSDH